MKRLFVLKLEERVGYFDGVMELLWSVSVTVATIIWVEVRCQIISCPAQYVYGPSTSSRRTVYVWHANTDGMHPSEPLCLSANYTVVRRRCQDGLWYPKHVDNCYSFECPKFFVGFDADKCFYQFPPPERICPDLRSILARTEPPHIPDGSDAPIVPLGSPFLCSYHAEEFLDISLAAANRIVAVLSFVKKLHLIVYYPEAMEVIRGKEAVYCYSSDVDVRLKVNRKPVDLKKLFQSSFSDGRTRNYAVFEVLIQDDPSQYWCQIYEIGQVHPIATERVVAHRRKLGNEYSLRVQSRGGLDLIWELCGGETCRLMEVSSFGEPAEYVLHFTAEATGDVPTQFSALQEELEARFGEYAGTAEITSFKSSEYCMPQNDTLNWSLTPLGSVALPLTMCLDSNGHPISRTCGGSFLYGAEWAEPERPCSRAAQVPEATKLLSDIVSRSAVDFGDLSTVASAPHNFSSVDVALMADGFKRARANSTLDFLKSMSKVMGLDQSVLRESQEQYKSMDKILGAIDDVLTRNPMPIRPAMEENLSVVAVRPFRDAAVGVAFYKRDRVRQILANQTLQDLPLENLEAVIVASRDLLEALTRSFPAEKKDAFQIIITTFKNDKLFLDMNGRKKAGSRIISVVIPDFQSYLFAPIDIFLRPMTSTKEIDCGYWDYGGAKHGTWSNMGGNFEGMFKDEMVHCSFTHLTHFALVVTSNETVTWKDELTSTGPNTAQKFDLIFVTTTLLLAKYF